MRLLRQYLNLRRARFRLYAPLTLVLASALLTACGVVDLSTTDQCRSEQDAATVCVLLTVEQSRLCGRTATTPATQSSCNLPALGGLLFCPYMVSEACGGPSASSSE